MARQKKQPVDYPAGLPRPSAPRNGRPHNPPPPLDLQDVPLRYADPEGDAFSAAWRAQASQALLDYGAPPDKARFATHTIAMSAWQFASLSADIDFVGLRVEIDAARKKLLEARAMAAAAIEHLAHKDFWRVQPARLVFSGSPEELRKRKRRLRDLSPEERATMRPEWVGRELNLVHAGAAEEAIAQLLALLDEARQAAGHGHPGLSGREPNLAVRTLFRQSISAWTHGTGSGPKRSWPTKPVDPDDPASDELPAPLFTLLRAYVAFFAVERFDLLTQRRWRDAAEWVARAAPQAPKGS